LTQNELAPLHIYFILRETRERFVPECEGKGLEPTAFLASRHWLTLTVGIRSALAPYLSAGMHSDPSSTHHCGAHSFPRAAEFP